MILELALALSITFGQTGISTIDIDPRLHLSTPDVIEFPWMSHGVCGLALPVNVALTVDHPWCHANDTLRHEDQHLDQYSALGPGLMLLQAASAGTAVEDYLGPEGSTWYPEPDQLGACPLIRIEVDEQRLHVMPCYNLGIDITTGA